MNIDAVHAFGWDHFHSAQRIRHSIVGSSKFHSMQDFPSFCALTHFKFKFNSCKISGNFTNKRNTFECLLFRLKNRGLLILILPGVSPASMAGIFRELGSWVVAQSLLNVLCLHHCTQLMWWHQQPRSQVLRRCRLQTQAKRRGEEVSVDHGF